MIINKFISKLKKYRKKKEWRKLNKHNDTLPVNDFNFDHVFVGKHTYGLLNVIDLNPKGSKLYIGSYCSIAEDVTFLLNAEHKTNCFFTYPIEEKILRKPEIFASSKGDIIVEEDVWIGYGSLILSGIKIGKGAIIAAGSVVTKDVLPYSIVGGNPAKIIKMRFSDSIISKIKQIDYNSIDEEVIIKNEKNYTMELKEFDYFLPNCEEKKGE